MEVINFSILETKTKIENEIFCVFGISARTNSGVFRFLDITENKSALENFIKTLENENVSLVELPYLIEDFLAELNTKVIYL